MAKKYFSNINNGKNDEASDSLLENINHLQYSKAFDSNDKFELISQDFKTVDLFIMLDYEAEILWGDYQNIFASFDDRYKAKELFSKIKSDFLSYVISVPEKFYNDGKEGFNLVSKEMLNQYYRLETGFIREEKQEDYIF